MILDTGRRVGVASKTDAGIIREMIVNQLRWSGGKTEGDYYVLTMGTLDSINGPAAYLFPDFEACGRVATAALVSARSRGLDREIDITPPTNLSPQARAAFDRAMAS